MQYKVTLAKRTAAGWDMDYSTGQAGHTGAYYDNKAEADAEADRRNQKLSQQCADQLGMSLEEYEDSGEASNAEEYYHVIEVD